MRHPSLTRAGCEPALLQGRRPLLLFLLVALAAAVAPRTRAHEVTWWENPFSGFPSEPLVLYVDDETTYPSEGGIYDDDASVTPSADEPCIVEVNLQPVESTLIQPVLDPVPFFSSTGVGNEVYINFDILRPPKDGDETALVKGEWHASGLPPNHDCNAVDPHPFTIPVRVKNKRIPWPTFQPEGDSFRLDTGMRCTLAWAPSPVGPWTAVGIGQKFLVCRDMPSGFFRRQQSLGGFLSGTVKDNLDQPAKGYDIGLIYGGANLKTGLDGFYSLPRLPKGDSLITISNQSGANLNIVVAPVQAELGTLHVALAAAPTPVPKPKACNCAPWCAIGFGEISGKRTPVYFGGGATNPTDGSPECTDAQVTVTPPKGAPFTIRAGRADSQNSGPNPASGIWTVTTVVCGVTKSCSVTVP